MKKDTLYPNPRFITDDKGNKLEVVLDIATYDKLIDLIEDYYLGQMAQEVLACEDKEEYVDMHEFKKRLLKDSSDDQ